MGVRFQSCRNLFVYFFVIEYSLRVYCCVEDPRYERSLLGRLKFMASFWSIVDLIAIIPYLYFITMHSVDRLGYDNDTAAATFSIVKLLRLLRLERHMETFKLYRRAFSNSGNWLLANGFVVIIVLALFSAILYYTERNNASAIENEEIFASIPSTMFLVMLMLFGEAPVVDLTPWGKLCAVIILFIGIMLLSTIISLFTNHFEIAAKENLERHQRTKRRWETAMKMATMQTKRNSTSSKQTRASRKARWSTVIKQLRTTTGRNLIMAGRRAGSRKRISSKGGRERRFFKSLKRKVAEKEAAAIKREAEIVASMTMKQKSRYMAEKNERAARDAKKTQKLKSAAAPEGEKQESALKSKLRNSVLKVRGKGKGPAVRRASA